MCRRVHELKLPLFQATVAYPLGLETDHLFGEGFLVVPNGTSSDGFHLQIDQRKPGRFPADGGTFVLRGPFQPAAVSLVLLDLFDWSPLGYVDLRYYVVAIESSTSHLEEVGQRALACC
jgi:hypothetical protein